MDIYQTEENDNYQNEKQNKKRITYSSPLIPLLENSLKDSPIKELKVLSQDLIKFNEYKEELANEITDPKHLKEIQSSFRFKLTSKLESLVIDALNMRIINNRNERIKKIYDWYNDRIDHFLQLREMKERTTPNKDQIEEEEPKKEEHYLSLKEINEHRTDIKGYENASKRIKNYHRKSLDNKATREIKFAFKDGVNLNYYYKENGFNNTFTSFKENISAASTYYDTFYKKNKMEIQTGSDWFKRTGLDFNKESKSSYSFIRPKYEYDYLTVEKNINIEKNKFMREKRNEEERIKAMKEFAFKKSFYNSNTNKNNEMKDMLNLYKVIVKNKKQEEEERKKKEEEDKRREDEEKKKKKKKKEKKKKKKKKKKKEEEDEKNKKLTYENHSDSEEKKEEEEKKENSIHFSEEEIKEPKPKVNLNDIKYIGPKINDNNKNIKRASTFGNMERTEIKININLKIKPYELKKQTIDSKIQYKIEKDIEVRESNQDNYNYNSNNVNNIQKEFPLQSDVSTYRDFTDRSSYLRKINSKLNNVNNVDVAKNNYFHHFTPLSFFDKKNTQIKTERMRSNDNSNTKKTENFMFKTFSNFKNDFLSMRRTLSSYHEEQMRNSKLYSRQGKRMRIKLDQMVYTPRDNINYPIIYLPVPGSSLLTNNNI